ncbi:MAG: tetratricopeptide repeat protein [Deltaproteobacteria bacterium]|nr:tetratricopeptide repeat protein [Deltaproteobacteria bacterium]
MANVGKIYDYPKPLNGGSPDDSIYFLMLAFVIISLSLLFIFFLIIFSRKFFKIKRNINIDNKHLIKKPLLAAGLSILFPGFGQVYLREIERGIIYILLTASVCAALFFSLSLTGDLAPTDENRRIVYFFINTLISGFLVFVYINSLIDAYSTANAINRKIVRVMRKNETYLTGLMKLGCTLYHKRHYQDALELYTAIISLYPTYALAHYNRAVVYYKIQNYAKSGIDFISAADLGHEKAKRIIKIEGIENLKPSV